MLTDRTLQDHAASLVSREVHLCVSSLVYTLATCGHDRHTIKSERHVVSTTRDSEAALGDMLDQAFELAAPVPDYESAAREAGWQFSGIAPEGAGFQQFWNPADPSLDFWESTARHEEPLAWEDLCNEFDIEPYENEVYEHWAVSDWLADKLEAKGEKIDRDFVGLTVWARTTTGQAISMDAVIEEIARELHS